jgi:hypothetical protein
MLQKEISHPIINITLLIHRITKTKFFYFVGLANNVAIYHIHKPTLGDLGGVTIPALFIGNHHSSWA